MFYSDFEASDFMLDRDGKETERKHFK